MSGGKALTFDYPIKVRFQCDRCALCCGDTKERDRTILLLKSEAERISLRLCRDIDEFADMVHGFEPYVYRMKKPSNGKCLFLKDGLCSIYALRPLVCRFYPFELKDSGTGRYVFICSHECPRIGFGHVLKKQTFDRLFRVFVRAMNEELSR